MEKEHEISCRRSIRCWLASGLILGAGLCVSVRGAAQPLRLQAPPAVAAPRPAEGLSLRMPETVRRNPSGYSPLCRLEIRLENTLPVSIWAELPASAAAPRAGALPAPHVQLKLLRF
ncbi:MAG: hypothetical protein NW241_20990 [Bacteroidia bacterium]|nr:hypothetical protein [Bacteroidia bacterium]